MPGGHAVRSSQLLEVDLISAKDLAPVAKFMRTYAVAWLQPDRKLETRVDTEGHTNPTWNDKFVFRVDNDFLDGEGSTITVEIHAPTRRGDFLVGSVAVPVSGLFPPLTRSYGPKKSSKMRFLTVQIRRPSGRAQGVLNLGVSLLDGTRRSCDLTPASSAVGRSDLLTDPKFDGRIQENSANKIKLRHCKSEISISDCTYPLKPAAGLIYSGSVLIGSELGGAPGKGGNKGLPLGSLCSDVGPSPSVVAAAIAMGLYSAPTKAAAADVAESSILDYWTDEDSVEGLRTKIERWRSEIHPLFGKNIINRNNVNNNNNNSNYQNQNYRSSHRRNEPKVRELRRAKSGLFSCFGTAYGCEFSITCGGGNRKKGLNSDNDHLTLSEVSYDHPYV